MSIGHRGFFGRNAELARIAEAFDSGARLLTLTGPPGVGKSHLAGHYARVHSSGAWTVPLASSRSRSDILASVAAALGLALSPANPELSLVNALDARGGVLLVLDDADFVIDALGELVRDWLDGAAELQLVVTSRERTQLAGEVLLEIGPLAASEAIELFLDRAQVEGDQAVIEKLVSSLEHLPLAIELAASRARILGPAQMLEAIDQRFSLLSTPKPSGRWTSLRAALEASWQLCQEDEREAWARCSLFRGGFSLEAALAVLGSGSSSAPAMDLLQRLRDRSLLVATAPRDTPGELRYDLYSSIAEFGAEKLANGSRGVFDFVAYFASWARERSSDLDGPDAAAALQRLSKERDNLRHAFELATSSADAAELGRALGALYGAMGPLEEAVRILGHCLAMPTMVQEPEQMRLRVMLADLGLRQGRLEDARELAALADSAGEPDFDLQLIAGRYHAARGDRERAVAAFERVLPTRPGRELQAARAHAGLAWELRSQPQQAEHHFDIAQRIFEERGAIRDIALTLLRAAQVELRTERLRDARASYRRAAELCRELGSVAGEAEANMGLGAICLDEGKAAEAEALFARAELLSSANGERMDAARFALDRGICLLTMGRIDEAYDALRPAAEQLQRAGATQLASSALGWLGATLAAADDIAGAQHCFEQALPAAAQAASMANRAAVQLHQGHLDLARARHARTQGNAAEADRLEKLAHMRVTAGQKGLAPQAGSHDLRWAARALQTALAGTPVTSADAPTAGDGRLEIGRNGRWFRPPDGERVDLSRRGAIRRLLDALAAHRDEHPDVALSREDLLAHGWPGERVLPEAGTRRVHTALWTLRKMGLRDLLLSRDDGYLLDPNTELSRPEG